MLLSDSGEEIQEQVKILELQREFYVKLYDVDDNVSFTLENTSGVRVSKSVQKQQCEQITMLDLNTAIKGMKNAKTPGEDGIPVDFYKVFWTKIQKPFYEMLKETYQENYLHRSARKGILNLIPKANKDTRIIKNLRPITLLNTDYKIIEKALANKMIPALKEIIHKDQRGFMKDRRISVNIRKMLDIIHEAYAEDLEAVVLSLDFVKCFDKCSFEILHGSLEYFGFGEVIKRWTKILYKDFSVRVQNNGNFSQDIEIKKGVHQGGCCSSIYFLVIAEILAISLRNNQDIEGITIKDIRNILNQFADDMDIFSLCKEETLRKIFNELESFRLQSGFTVSYDKTTLYRIGSLRFSNAQLYNMDQYVWSKEDINVLGVTIAHEEIVSKNYSSLIQKAKKTLNSWENRGLSLFGKVQVINTLIASLFVHKMMVLPFMPQNTIKTLDNIFRDFIWDGKKSKIAYAILQNSKSEGGVDLVNLRNKEIALKATWPFILKGEEEYAQIAYHMMRVSSLGENIWRCRISEDDVKQLKIKNTFWENVLTSWSKFNYHKDFRVENQILWYNSCIKIDKKIFFWKNMYLNGLMYVHQLFENQRFKGYEQVKTEFGMGRMKFNSLKAALPVEWKQYFQEEEKITYLPCPPHTYDKCMGDKNISRKIYKYLGDDIMLVHSKYINWKKEIGEDFTPTLYEFGQLHKEIYKLTNVPKYRSFQYRVMQRSLVTNIQLQKWGIKPEDTCTFCLKHRETITHLLAECEVVQAKIWQKLKQEIASKYQIGDIDLRAENIILNSIAPKKKNVLNFMCLIAKQYIYRCRCQAKELSFESLKREIRQIECIEKYIAIRNGKKQIHDRKWEQNKGEEEQISQYVERYFMGLSEVSS